MQDWLHVQANANPDKTALITAKGRWTFAQLQRLVSECAAVMQSVGITEQSRIGLLLKNNVDYVVFVLAVLRCGSVIVPLNVRLQVDELAYQLKNAAVNVLITAPDFHDKARKAIETAYGSPEALALYSLYETTQDDEFTPFPTYDRQHTDQPILEHEVDLDLPLAIIHTSGTSGTPKGAVLTYGNIFYSALGSAYRLGHQPEDIWLCVLPLFHIGGLSIILRAILYGITVNLYERFDVDAVNRALAHEGISLVSLVPTMLYRLLEARQTPWSDRLRLVLLGGASAAPELIQRCHKEGIPIATTYGMTEAASQVATALPQQVQHKPGTVGKPLFSTRIRITDGAGFEQPTGIYGEVLVKGPTVMRGYINDDESTASTLCDGWLRTGDIGYLDEDGDLWVVQRRTDLIISGGENIYPAEVETVLCHHPAVKEAVVVGLPDAEWGQRAAAAVQLRDGHVLTAQDLIAFCREKLAGYKVPKVIRFLDTLPQTESGKIERKTVRKLFEEN